MVMDPPEGVVSRTLSRDGQWENHTDVGHLVSLLLNIITARWAKLTLNQPLKIDDVHGRAPARP